MEKLNFEKCYKVNCSPPLEVYKGHINYFGQNMEIKDVDKNIKEMQRKADMLIQAKKVWEKNFKECAMKGRMAQCSSEEKCIHNEER